MMAERRRKLHIIGDFYSPWISVWFYPGCDPDTLLKPFNNGNEEHWIISKAGNKFWNLVEL